MCSEFKQANWRGVSLKEICGATSPWEAPEFPAIAPCYDHAVLYPKSCIDLLDDQIIEKISPTFKFKLSDDDFVRLPCSNQLYTVKNDKGESEVKNRWEVIKSTLSKPIRNSHDLVDAILSYNSGYKNIWKFEALHKFLNEYLEEDETHDFFNVTLPEISRLALALPNLIQSPIPLLKQNKNQSVSLTQQQVASFLANAFFCTWPMVGNINSLKRTYPRFNFYTLYEASDSQNVLEKLKCICHYFRKAYAKVPGSIVTVSRRSVTSAECPEWAESQRPLASVPLHVDHDTFIEDADGLIQVDFANRFLGGAVLRRGCVQEEIRFVICPELMVSMLFTEEMKPYEAVMIIGCERYSKYSGYSKTFKFEGDYIDTTPLDSSGRRRCAVLAIDATRHTVPWYQYNQECINRELNKVWTGISFFTNGQDTLQYPGVATGNWGCGAYRGSPDLKSLLQLMACAEARRPMAYYTFGNVKLRDDIHAVYNLLASHNVTVGQLYNHIISFCATEVRKNKLHSYLRRVLGEETNSTDREEMDSIEKRKLKKANRKQKMESSNKINSEDIMAENHTLFDLEIHEDG